MERGQRREEPRGRRVPRTRSERTATYHSPLLHTNNRACFTCSLPRMFHLQIATAFAYTPALAEHNERTDSVGRTRGEFHPRIHTILWMHAAVWSTAPDNRNHSKLQPQELQPQTRTRTAQARATPDEQNDWLAPAAARIRRYQDGDAKEITRIVAVKLQRSLDSHSLPGQRGAGTTTRDEGERTGRKGEERSAQEGRRRRRETSEDEEGVCTRTSSKLKRRSAPTTSKRISERPQRRR